MGVFCNYVPILISDFLVGQSGSVVCKLYCALLLKNIKIYKMWNLVPF